MMHPEIFKKILELILDIKIDKIKYLNTELSIFRFIEKGKRLDVYIESNDSYIDIEVTQKYNESIINRNVSFMCQIYAESTKKGSDYNSYKNTRLINLIFGRNNEYAIENYELKSDSGKTLTKKLLYSEIYIDTLKKKCYNKEEVNKYKYLIMLSLTIKKLEQFNKEYGDDIVQMYLNSLKDLSVVDEFVPLFTKEEDEKRIRRSERNLGFLEGEKKGIKQGFLEGEKKGIKQGFLEGSKKEKIKTAKNLIKIGIDMETISKATGLSKKELLKLV